MESLTLVATDPRRERYRSLRSASFPVLAACFFVSIGPLGWLTDRVGEAAVAWFVGWLLVLGTAVPMALLGWPKLLDAVLARAFPDLTLVLSRHHLDWGDQRVLLESIDVVRGPPLMLRSGATVLALKPGHARPREEAAFIEALKERVAVLRKAEDREAQRAALERLAGER